MADMSVQTTFSAAPAIGYEGMLDAGAHDIMTFKNAESTAAIAFGRAVVFKGSPTTDKDAVLPALETNKVAGIVVHSHAYSRVWTDASGTKYGELDTDGLRPGTLLNVLRKGRVLVRCEDGCVPGDRLWVRCTVGSPSTVEYLGSLNNADEGTEMIDCTTQGVWLTTASAEGLAWLDVDFTNEP